MKKLHNWLVVKGGRYVILQFVLFALIWFAPAKLLGWEWPAAITPITAVLGALCVAYGVVMVGLGIVNLGRNLTAVPHPKPDSTLVQNGAFALVRHPIYSGLIVGALGIALSRQGGLTLVLTALLFLFFDIKSRREERLLAAQFAAYSTYQARVKKLLPYLY